jgi:hypothetical protein
MRKERIICYLRRLYRGCNRGAQRNRPGPQIQTATLSTAFSTSRWVAGTTKPRAFFAADFADICVFSEITHR